MKKSLLVIAGEDSGDMHAADVIRELKSRDPEFAVWGIGGEKLRAQGMETLHDVHEMNVMGFVEVLKRYSFFKTVFAEVLAEVDKRKPDAALLVDYPGFNLRLAAELKKRGVKVLYYVCPQVWAWKKDRIPKMAETIERLMVIFPFEVDVFKDVDLKVDFVGHPMVDELREFREAEPVPLPWGEGKKIALLPGSREQEIRRILPSLLNTALEIEKGRPDVSFLIAVPTRQEPLVEEIFQKVKGAPLHCSIVTDCSREVLKQADAALVASGTATLEAALLHCPTVLVYKTSPLTYAIAKHLIQIPWLGIANIISGREIMPERIQKHMRAIELAVTLDPLMNDTPQRAAMIENFQTLDLSLAGRGESAFGLDPKEAQRQKLLGSGGPAARVAQIICDETA